MTDKLTMAEVWEDLDQIELDMLAKMTGIEKGPLALSKIITVLRAVIYRHHDQDVNMQMQQASFQAQLAHARQMASQQSIQNTPYSPYSPYQTYGVSNTGTSAPVHVWPPRYLSNI